ncbi:phosphotransferase [Pirellulales bacterium]|nr:phosphotransferase [Pirellulales bacterium]
MPPEFHLMPSAKKKLNDTLRDQVRRELAAVFPDAIAGSVYDVLTGFQPDQARKVILAVEAETPSKEGSESIHEAHVVKLGGREDVSDDVRGWKDCVEKSRMQRMFVEVRQRPLPDGEGRAAVVYQDASQWYDMLTQQDEFATLAWGVNRAVFWNETDVPSVERIIRQVFEELGRALFRQSSDDESRAEGFYRAKLRFDATDTPNVHHWRNSELRRLRRDVDWLVSGPLSPAADNAPGYVDPYDYVTWALANRFPATLVGPSHGDLHANNILVGVAGQEIEYPLIIDYGDMAVDNVVAWDFAKLESELKVQLLAKLSQDRETTDFI